MVTISNTACCLAQEELPPTGALQNIVDNTEPPTKYDLRTANKELCELVSASIKTLRALDGLLPQHAWHRFPNADGLVIQCTEGSVTVDSDHYATKRISDEVVNRTAEVLRNLPSTTTHLNLHDHSITCYEQQGLQLAHTLSTSRSAPHLNHLSWTWALEPTAADMLLSNSNQLRSLHLHVGHEDILNDLWKPSLPACLSALHLKGSFDNSVNIDLSPLSSLTNLQQLHLQYVYTSHTSSISSLQQLTSLSLQQNHDLQRITSMTYYSSTDILSDTLSELTPLTNLQQFTYTGELTPQGWALLSTLPQLQNLTTETLTVDAATPAQQLTSLISWRLRVLGLGHNTATQPGQLCSTLPLLEHLSTGLQGTCTLVRGLQGHQHLQQIKLRLYTPQHTTAADDWQQRIFCTIPNLTSLELVDIHATDGLLVDLAACGKLRRCVIVTRSFSGTPGISSMGLAALAATASSSTLHTLHLRIAHAAFDPSRLRLADVLPLLSANMPQMESLEVAVQQMSGAELRELAQQLGRPVEVLRKQCMQGS